MFRKISLSYGHSIEKVNSKRENTIKTWQIKSMNIQLEKYAISCSCLFILPLL